MEKDIIPDDVALRLQALSERLKQDTEDEEALIERGRLYWALGRRSEAINDYLAARRINPEGKAKELLKATYDILNFYNKDLYNP
ncbi:MAG: hypothetical protein K2K75_02450 [Muribaculaceae bacterium]|nr:hypothetical protein [Muribaculaceae bacterium]